MENILFGKNWITGSWVRRRSSKLYLKLIYCASWAMRTSSSITTESSISRRQRFISSWNIAMEAICSNWFGGAGSLKIILERILFGKYLRKQCQRCIIVTEGQKPIRSIMALINPRMMKRIIQDKMEVKKTLINFLRKFYIEIWNLAIFSWMGIAT